MVKFQAMSVKETEKFAVLEINDKQFIVSQNDIFKIDNITENPSVKVLLYSEGNTVDIGKPILDNYGAKIEVLRNYKDKKISTSRYKSKSRYRRNKSHRQNVTDIKILEFGKAIETKIITDNDKSAENKDTKGEEK